MKRLTPFEIFFLATETRSSHWHMAGCEVFELPRNAPANFVAKLVEDMRAQSAIAPFNQIPDTSGLWPRWRTVEPDMGYHLSHQVLPAPGTDSQLMEALEHFGAATLDRNAPLWECCVFEGMQNGRFAIGFKVHHSLVDGQGGLKIILRAMSNRRGDKTARTIWGNNPDLLSTAGKSRVKPIAKRAATDNWSKLNQLWSPTNTTKLIRQLYDLRLFRARRSVLNQAPLSSARKFGIGDLPLELMTAAAKAHAVTINDVLLCVVDAGLHRYFAESGQTLPDRLIAAMPVSTRKEGQEGGNAAGLLTIELGQDNADITSRLAAVRQSTDKAKSLLRELPAGFIIAYGISVLGMPLLLQRLGLGDKLPLINLGVSNVSPPKGANYLDQSLYLRGARLTGLYTQPILAPSVLLNVTAASMQGKLCLGIGSTREAIAEPLKLAEFIAAALDDLAVASHLC